MDCKLKLITDCSKLMDDNDRDFDYIVFYIKLLFKDLYDMPITDFIDKDIQDKWESSISEAKGLPTYVL